MMTSRILKFMNSLKIQKSEDLESETFFSANKKNVYYTFKAII